MHHFKLDSNTLRLQVLHKYYIKWKGTTALLERVAQHNTIPHLRTQVLESQRVCVTLPDIVCTKRHEHAGWINILWSTKPYVREKNHTWQKAHITYQILCCFYINKCLWTHKLISSELASAWAHCLLVSREQWPRQRAEPTLKFLSCSLRRCLNFIPRNVKCE